MRFNLRSGIPPRNNGKSQPILAKGPQDCIVLTPQEFSRAIAYVAKAFLSSAVVPKEFFTGISPSSNLGQDSVQRTLLASYAHFNSNGNKALSFYFRYIALLKLIAQADMSEWVTRDPESEYALFSAEIITVAAKQRLLSSGQFDHVEFLGQLRSLSLPQPLPHEYTDLAAERKLPYTETAPERIAA